MVTMMIIGITLTLRKPTPCRIQTHHDHDHHNHDHNDDDDDDDDQEIEALTCTALRETGRNHWSLHIEQSQQPQLSILEKDGKIR